jgi:hypothetical protein
MNNDLVEPWARGPFELIRHANGHLLDGGDTDRRIALIGFDNAIEVCIDVYIKLHPRLRDGFEIQKEDLDRITRNYHTKIEFLDRYVESRKISLDVSIEAIVWYHSLRNELYHSGNGMVPEFHVLEGARSAAVSVFNALFNADISFATGDKPTKATKQTAQIPFVAQNDEMEFLRLFIEFEHALESALKVLAPKAASRPRPIRQMWDEYKALVKVPQKWDMVVQEVLPLRNRIAHGQTVNADSEEIIGAYLELSDVTDEIRASIRSDKTLKIGKKYSIPGAS